MEPCSILLVFEIYKIACFKNVQFIIFNYTVMNYKN